MRANTKIAMKTHRYYIKVEELAIFMKDYAQALQNELHNREIKESKYGEIEL